MEKAPFLVGATTHTINPDPSIAAALTIRAGKYELVTSKMIPASIGPANPPMAVATPRKPNNLGNNGPWKTSAAIVRTNGNRIPKPIPPNTEKPRRKIRFPEYRERNIKDKMPNDPMTLEPKKTISRPNLSDSDPPMTAPISVSPPINERADTMTPRSIPVASTYATWWATSIWYPRNPATYIVPRAQNRLPVNASINDQDWDESWSATGASKCTEGKLRIVNRAMIPKIIRVNAYTFKVFLHPRESINTLIKGKKTNGPNP